MLAALLAIAPLSLALPAAGQVVPRLPPSALLPPAARPLLAPSLSAPSLSPSRPLNGSLSPVFDAIPALRAPLAPRLAAPNRAPSATYAPGVMGLVQYDGDAHFGEYGHNMAELTRLAGQAVARGARIVVMPEGSAYGYASKDELWCKPGMATFRGKRCRDVSAVAESVPGGRSSEHWSAFARANGVYVLFSVLERDGDRFHNAMGVASPDGTVGRYRKRRLYYTDQAYAEPGTDPFILDTPYGRFGLLICLDATDSPYFREYKAAGASAVIVSMDWDDDPDGQHAAVKKFRQWAGQDGVDIYAADSAPWDGAGKYPASGAPRERDGLPETGVGHEGVSTHRFVYPKN